MLFTDFLGNVLFSSLVRYCQTKRAAPIERNY